jgi:hypothetical protein
MRLLRVSGVAAFQHAAVRNFRERRFTTRSRRNLWSNELLGGAGSRRVWHQDGEHKVVLQLAPGAQNEMC